MKILWVENNQRFADIALRCFLEPYSVDIVPSVASAREVLHDTRFDLIMLDYDLDDGKGTELIGEILSIPDRPTLIATSSHRAGNIALMAAGADSVCSKMEFANIGQVIADTIATLAANR